MIEEEVQNVFSSLCMWTGAAHRQRMPCDVPNGPSCGELARILAFRDRAGVSTVTVTWPAEDRINLSQASFEYRSPREALDAGWELGEKYKADAAFMEHVVRT